MLETLIKEQGDQHRDGFGHRDNALLPMLQSHDAETDAALQAMLDDLNRPDWSMPLNEGMASEKPEEKYRAYDLLAKCLVETIMRIIQSDKIFDPLLDSQVQQPANDAMCIRYLSAEKWLWMLDQKAIPFMSPESFDDRYDCKVPIIVLENALHRFIRLIDEKQFGNEWIEHVFYEWQFEQKRIRDRYRISCWNLLDQSTSTLMWGQYANHRTGVAVVCPYKTLVDAIQEYEDGGHAERGVEFLTHGLVSYDLSDTVTSHAFLKRPEFADEREVRLTAHTLEGNNVELPLHTIASDLEIRLPLDAPNHHVDAVHSTWRQLQKSIV